MQIVQGSIVAQYEEEQLNFSSSSSFSGIASKDQILEKEGDVDLEAPSTLAVSGGDKVKNDELG